MALSAAECDPPKWAHPWKAVEITCTPSRSTMDLKASYETCPQLDL